MAQVYSVSFSSADSTAVIKDIFMITASTVSNFIVRELRINQIAAALTSTAIELLSLTIYRGSSIASAGGATATPVNVDSRSDATATFTTLVNSSTPGSSGAVAQLLYSSPWNTQLPFVWRPPKDERPVCKLSQRLQVRLGAPGAAMVIGGSMIIEEIGKFPGGTAQ